MGKVKARKSSAPKASKGPIKAPSSKASSSSKKRVSSKAAAAPTKSGGILATLNDAFSGGSMPSLPSLPSLSSASSSIQFNPNTGTFQHRKKSRKGLSASDIKGFMRVNKFAGMLTKVTGHKHTPKSHRRK